MYRILLIDDDMELCELLQEYLGAEGLEIVCAHRGDHGAEQALKDGFELVILDVMLPGMNGFDVLRAIRAESQIPVIMLTARGEEVDRIVGLELGADDYLPKPFNPRELIARIHAIERRVAAGRATEQQAEMPEPELIEVGDVRLSHGSRQVRCAGKNIELTSAEFDLLAILLRHAGEVVRRDELIEGALGRRNSPYDRSVDVHISALRKKLGHKVAIADDAPERIITVRNVGYMYAAGKVN